jgi:head-to-tail connecting protein
MAETAAAVLRRHGQLKAQQASWLNGCQEIAMYVVPHKSNITLQREPGAQKTEVLFDSTAIHAANLLASAIHGTMTPSTQPWISLKMRDEALNAQTDVKTWLEDDSTRIHKALRQSNFSTSVHEMYLDLVAFGMGCMLIEEADAPQDGGFGGFRFTVPAVGTYFVAEDKDGRVDTVYRELTLSRRACVQKWGDKVGPDFMSATKTKPDETVTVIHGVYPRQDRAYGRDGHPKPGGKNMAWVSCYALTEPKILLDEGGFEEFPYVVPRWSKTPGEVTGTGPSHVAIPDIKTLNAFVMFMLQAIPMAMQPPTIERDDSVLGDPDLTPGGRNVVGGSGALDDNFRFMQTGYRPEVAGDFYQRMEQKIERVYHVNELQLRESPQMTATEVQVRYELMQRLLGPTTGRLESEFLTPFTLRCFAVMARRMAFQALPQALQESTAQQSNAADLDVEYEGPLARAQRTIELTAQDRVMTFILQTSQIVAAVAPDLARAMLDLPNLDKWIRDRGEITGLPTDSFWPEDYVQQLREHRQQQQAQAQQMQGMQAATEMAKNAAPMLAAMGQQNGGAQPAQNGKAA